jgi:SAM-dependent methyltransferase
MRQTELQRRYNEWHRQRLAQDVAALEIDPRELRFFDWLLGLAPPRAGQSLLDVACGQGHFLAYAASRSLEVSGIDLSDLAVGEARKRLPEADIRVGAAESLPFEDESFDRVTCLGSLEHFPDPPAGAREMQRVLARGGTAIIYLPNLFFLGHVWLGLRHGIEPSEGGQGFSESFKSSQGWAELLSEAGFTVRDYHPWNYIYASEKVSPIVRSIWNLVSRVMPRNGAYCFAFVCSR